MRKLENEIFLKVPVDKAFEWFVNMDSNYLMWHPSTHKKFQWLTEKPIKKGTLFYFEEEINGHEHQMFMEISEYIENEKLSFISNKINFKSKILSKQLIEFLSSFFRIRIEMKRNFIIVSQNSTILKTTHIFGCHIPLISKLVDWFIDKFIFSSKSHK